MKRRGALRYVAARSTALMGAFVLAMGIGACTAKEPSRPTTNQEAQTKTVIIPIEGMSCSACAARVKKTLASIDGVSDGMQLLRRRAKRHIYPKASISFRI